MIIFNPPNFLGIIFIEMSKILDRIQEIANNEGITIGALERKLGASKGVLSRAIAHGTDIQAKWLEVLVENYPRYSADWLLTGEGSMLAHGRPGSTNSLPAATADNSLTSLIDTIKEQAIEIGELREKVRSLERENNRLVSDATESGTATAG